MAIKNFGDAGELFPQSVFIIASYDENGVPNAMNAAWAGECSRHEICFNIGDHKTTANICVWQRFSRHFGCPVPTIWQKNRRCLRFLPSRASRPCPSSCSCR